MPRLITFFRHATAQDRAEGIEDETRKLIRKGRKQAARVASFCERNELIPMRLLCSPVLRARETAAVFSANLPGCPEIEIAEWLRMGTAPSEICASIRREAAGENCDIWLVGHEPDFSLTIAQLLGLEVPPVKVRKASITRLEAGDSPSTACILWSMPCQFLR